MGTLLAFSEELWFLKEIVEGPLVNAPLAEDVSSLATDECACVRTLFILAFLRFTN